MAAVGGGLLSVALGAFGLWHEPDLADVPTLGFPSVIAMKVWLGLVVGVLALLQLLSALWMYGRIRRPAPASIGTVHRLTRLLALLVSLPVAFACLYGIGFYTGDLRVLLHSAAGCLLYGAFVVKVAGLHAPGPSWVVRRGRRGVHAPRPPRGHLGRVVPHQRRAPLGPLSPCPAGRVGALA